MDKFLSSFTGEEEKNLDLQIINNIDNFNVLNSKELKTLIQELLLKVKG